MGDNVSLKKLAIVSYSIRRITVFTRLTITLSAKLKKEYERDVKFRTNSSVVAAINLLPSLVVSCEYANKYANRLLLPTAGFLLFKNLTKFEICRIYEGLVAATRIESRLEHVINPDKGGVRFIVVHVRFYGQGKKSLLLHVKFSYLFLEDDIVAPIFLILVDNLPETKNVPELIGPTEVTQHMSPSGSKGEARPYHLPENSSYQDGFGGPRS